MRADAEQAHELAPEGSPGRAVACLLAGTAARLAGDEDAATLLDAGAHRAAVSAPDIHALCLTQLALPALAREDWEEAGALVTRARAQVERHGLEGYPTSALVLAASALVRAHRGRVEGAQRDLADALALRAQLTDFAAWYEVELSVVLARVAVRLSDVNGARELLTDASRSIGRLGGAAMLEAWLAESWARLDAAGERPAVIADDRGAQDAALPAHPPLVPRDRRAGLRVGQHGQDAGQLGLPQARRVVPLRGRLPGASARAARRLAR